MEQARATNSVEVARAQAQLTRLQRQMTVSMNGIDVIMSPVVTGPPPETGVFTQAANRSIETWMDEAWKFAPYPEIFNVTSQPAMSVPLYESENRLPIGIHFAGRVGDDLTLLQLARQLEIALPWQHRRPPMCGL